MNQAFVLIDGGTTSFPLPKPDCTWPSGHTQKGIPTIDAQYVNESLFSFNGAGFEILQVDR